MDILAIAAQIVMLLLLMGCGIFLRQRKVMTDPVIKGVNQIVLQVAWPAMIIMTTQKEVKPEIIPGFLRTLVCAAIIMAVFTVLLLLLSGHVMPHSRSTVFCGLCSMPNAGFVGLPLVQAAYGSTGVMYLSAYIVAFNLVLWTLYQWMFAGREGSGLKMLVNSGLVASVIGTALLLMRVRLPEPFASLSNQLGVLTTPLSMLLLGARLQESLHIKQLGDKALWCAVGVRLLLFPLAVYAVLHLLGFKGMELGVLVMASAMPAASSTQMLAEKHDMDRVLAAQGVSITLLLCVVTIPLLLSILPM